MKGKTEMSDGELPKDDPRIMAWEEYSKSDKFLSHLMSIKSENRRVDAMWDIFIEGWEHSSKGCASNVATTSSSSESKYSLIVDAKKASHEYKSEKINKLVKVLPYNVIEETFEEIRERYKVGYSYAYFDYRKSESSKECIEKMMTLLSLLDYDVKMKVSGPDDNLYYVYIVGWEVERMVKQ